MINENRGTTVTSEVFRGMKARHLKTIATVMSEVEKRGATGISVDAARFICGHTQAGSKLFHGINFDAEGTVMSMERLQEIFVAEQKAATQIASDQNTAVQFAMSVMSNTAELAFG